MRRRRDRVEIGHGLKRARCQPSGKSTSMIRRRGNDDSGGLDLAASRLAQSQRMRKAEISTKTGLRMNEEQEEFFFCVFFFRKKESRVKGDARRRGVLAASCPVCQDESNEHKDNQTVVVFTEKTQVGPLSCQCSNVGPSIRCMRLQGPVRSGCTHCSLKLIFS